MGFIPIFKTHTHHQALILEITLCLINGGMSLISYNHQPNITLNVSSLYNIVESSNSQSTQYMLSSSIFNPPLIKARALLNLCCLTF